MERDTVCIVVDCLENLHYPYDDFCVNYIVRNWVNDHTEEIKEIDGFEIDEEDVKIYWFDYVRENYFT